MASKRHGLTETKIETQILDKDQACFLADKIKDLFGPEMWEKINGNKADTMDMILFGPVGRMCCKVREDKGEDLKEIAKHFKLPQYRLKDVEENNRHSINKEILERYIDYLGLRAWFEKWLRNNKDVYDRLGTRNKTKT